MRLSVDLARRMLRKLAPELGISDQKRVDKLIAVMGEETLNLGEVLTALYGADDKKALNSFRVFRYNLKQAASETGVTIALAVDSQKQSAPSQRRCYFEGEADFGELEAYTRDSIDKARLERTVTPKGQLTYPAVRYFALYAQDEAQVAEELLEELQIHLQLSSRHKYQLHDGILPTTIEEERQLRDIIDTCQLLFVFFSLRWMLDDRLQSIHETIRHVSRTKVIFVSLDHVKKEDYDLGGFEFFAFFSFKPDRGYLQCNDEERKRFCKRLYDTTELFLKDPRVAFMHGMLMREEAPDLEGCIEPKAQLYLFEDSLETYRPDQAVDVVDEMYAWAVSESQQRFCALLGEYGMGKTIACMLLAQKMIDAQKSIACIFIDLRLIGKIARDDIDLDYILNKAIKRNRNTRHVAPISAELIKHAVRNERALVIFDGLDEVIVHLTPFEGQEFIRELWRTLPIRRHDDPRSGKIIISCRSHYFRNVVDQNGMFTGEDREQIDASDYLGYVMLPFSEAQVREYLAINLPEYETQRLMEMLDAVHNLSELSRRAFNLAMITRILPEIEHKFSRQERVEGVTLYKLLVQKWLKRDEGKHRLGKVHKEQLMSHLAVAMWEDGARQWSVDELENWLDIFLIDHWQIGSAYQRTDREILKEDLRTATFVIREDNDNFAFAHSSIQEYFIADFLCRELSQKAPERTRLALQPPSEETITFAAQLIAVEKDMRKKTRLLSGMQQCFADYHSRSSELILRLYMKLTLLGVLFKVPKMDLRGAALERMTLAGDAAHRLDLSGADFSGASMRGVVVKYADLSRCRFEKTAFQNAEVQQTLALHSIWQGDLTGALFRDCGMRGAQFEVESALHDATFIRCDGLELGPLPQTQKSAIYFDRGRTGLQRRKGLEELKLYSGHKGPVTAVALSGDGARIVSGSEDGSVIIWDAQSGRELLRLQGHEDWVNTVALSGDGTRIVSGSLDRSVIVWDAQSGRERLCLQGHEYGVTAVALSGDGEQIVSGSRDGSMIVWDAHDGRLLKRIHFLPNGEWATVDPVHNKALAHSEEAWRYLGWSRCTPERIYRFPFECDVPEAVE